MKETWRFLKFVLFSASAGIIEMGSFALLNELLDWPYWPSYLIALVLSVLWMLLQAPDLAITEAAVGAGVSSILMFAALKKINGIRDKGEKEHDEKEA